VGKIIRYNLIVQPIASGQAQSLESIKKFEDGINRAIAEGWELYGNTFWIESAGAFVQAVIKREVKPQDTIKFHQVPFD
jgi:Domain of unknown function (DUF1737)